jgi:tetratricopeptide (TPR) repeat protein
MDLYFQGMACANKGLTPEHMTQARGFFERALGSDPGNVEALVGTAWVDYVCAASLFADDRAALFAVAEAAFTNALSLAPEHAWAHLGLGSLRIHTNRTAQGIAECERALALDRNLAAAHGTIGLAKTYVGHCEETEAHINEALRLSPRDTFAYLWFTFAGTAKLLLSSDEEAVTLLRRGVETNQNWPPTHFFLAAALAHLGQHNEAHAAAQAGLALNPSFTVRRARVGAPSDNPTYLAQRERIYEGMCKAGVPEG